MDKEHNEKLLEIMAIISSHTVRLGQLTKINDALSKKVIDLEDIAERQQKLLETLEKGKYVPYRTTQIPR